MKKKSICMMLVLIVLMSGMVFASGQKDDADAETSSESPVEIRIQTWKTERGPQFEEAIHQGELDGIKINYTPSELKTHYQTIRVDFSAGTPADIIEVPIGGYYKEFYPYLQSIEPYAEADIGSNWKDIFVEKCVTDLDYFGEWRAFPCGMVSMPYILYNKDLFDKFNLKPPKTFEELKQVSQVFRNNGYAPLVVGGKDYYPARDIIQAICDDIAPGVWLEAEDGERPMTDPVIIKAFEYWGRMAQEGVFQDGFLGIPQYMDGCNMFLEQKGAMFFNGSWTMNFWTSSPYKEKKDQFRMGVMQFPDFNGDGKLAPVHGGLDVTTCFVKDTKNPEITYQVIKYLSIGKGAPVLYNALLQMPSIKDFKIDWDNIIDTMNPVDEEELQSVYGFFQDVNKTLVGRRNYYNPYISDLVLDYSSEVALGVLTAEEALEQLNQEYVKLNKW